jgi:YVTN family beta-propeller protein
VANRFDNTVSKISAATNTVVATIPVGSFPNSIAFTPTQNGPTNKDQCKNGGWATFTNPSFTNQGQCIKFVNHMDEH